MSDVEIFKAELLAASAAVRTAVDGLVIENANLQGEDTGIGNPGSRPTLRLEVRRHLVALRAAALMRAETASGVAASAQRVADRYTDLDVELTGRDSA